MHKIVLHANEPIIKEQESNDIYLVPILMY